MRWQGALFLLLGLLAWAQEEKVIWDVYASGGLAYLATGEGVRVLDARLQERGFLGGFPAYGLAGEENRLYAASDYGLYVLSSGESPRVLARVTGFPARSVLVREGRAYLGGPGGLGLVDLTGEVPRLVGRLPGFAVWGVALEGDRAYLATDRGLVVADVALPEAPKVVAQVSLGPTYAVALWQGRVYLAAGDGLRVLTEEEGTWKEVARRPGFRAYRLAIREGLLLSVGIGGLQIFSLEDPSAPRLLASRQALAYTGLSLAEEALWVASPTGVFLHAFKLPELLLLASTEAPVLAAKENPRFLEKYGGYGAWAAGDLLYLATRDGVKVVSLKDPKAPRLVGQVKGFVAYALFLKGDTLYVGGADGLRAFRVKGPGQLEQKVYLRQKAVYALRVVQDVVYLGTAEGLVSVVWQGSTPVVAARVGLGPVYALWETGGRLYVGGLQGLAVVGLGKELKGLQVLLKEPVYALAFHGGYVYLGGPAGLRVYRLEDPLKLTLMTSLPGFPAWHLALEGKSLFLMGEGGVYLLDLSDPASPQVLRHEPGLAWSYLVFLGGFLYGLGPDGIYLIQVQEDRWLVLGLALGYLAQVSAPPSPPKPPAPAKGWNGTYWVKTWGALGFFFYQPETKALAIAVDAKGFVYVGGTTTGSLPGGVHQGEEDAFLAKFDPSGKLLWLRQFGTPLGEGVFALGVDSAGNVYATGHTLGSLGGRNQGDWDFFVAKFSPEGRRLFLKQHGTPYWDKATGLALDGRGNIYVAGFTYGAFPGQRNAGDRDYFLAKLDREGRLTWARQGGSAGGEVTLGLAFSPEGALYLVGTTEGTLPGQGSQGGEDIFVVKYDPAGNRLWARQLGTPQNDRGQSVRADGSGVYVAGTTKGSFRGEGLGTRAFLLKLSPKGETLWAREFGVSVVEGEGVITGSAYVALGQGGSRVYLADSARGDLPGYLGAGGVDVFVLEYDAKGNLLGVLQSGTEADNLAYALAVGPKGEVYVVGTTGAEAFLAKVRTPLPAYVGE